MRIVSFFVDGCFCIPTSLLFRGGNGITRPRVRFTAAFCRSVTSSRSPFARTVTSRLRSFHIFLWEAKALSSRLDFLLDGFELTRPTLFPKCRDLHNSSERSLDHHPPIARLSQTRSASCTTAIIVATPYPSILVTCKAARDDNGSPAGSRGQFAPTRPHFTQSHMIHSHSQSLSLRERDALSCGHGDGGVKTLFRTTVH